MEQTETLIERFKELPELLRYQVLDFVEFLVVRYNIENQEEGDNTPTEEQKQTLDKRHAASKNNPENRIEWRVLKQELFEKYKHKQTV